MSRKPSASQNMALKAAAMVARQNETVAVAEPQVPPEPPIAAVPTAESDPPASEGDIADSSRRGRPRGKRPVAARQTIYLDKPRHAALARIAEDRGRSVHSLILEGIDYVIQKPAKPGWQ